jgi:hypothetical protein
MKIFKFFHFKIRGIFQLFSFPSIGMAFFFSNFKIDIFSFFPFPSIGMAIFFQISKSNFFIFFPFPSLVVWPIFFQYSKTKCFNSNFKNEIVFISNFPYGINDFFLTPRLPNVFKNWKITITLTKNSPRIAYHHWSTVKKSSKTKDVPKQSGIM